MPKAKCLEQSAEYPDDQYYQNADDEYPFDTHYLSSVSVCGTVGSSTGLSVLAIRHLLI